MPKTVVGIFQSERVAKEAVEDLRKAGFDREISVLAKGQEGGQQADAEQAETGTAMGIDANDAIAGNAEPSVADGATTGGVLGGLAGLAVGAGALVIPGLGPLVAAGPIAGLLSGAATGGVGGALVDWGIPAEEGRHYEEQIKQGKIMVSVNTDEQHASQAQEILKNHGAEEIKTHDQK
ncbi:MAG: hypothetical protein PWQ96_804 [Clostridia bacterium]|nr:hypothetical protein [Clostridiales bacterium]MDK2985162.1 hypothetical protein [Clostridia bacterium]